MTTGHQSLKLALAALQAILFFQLFTVPVGALKVGTQASSGFGQCSNTCESDICTVPFLRYGKYCGYLYTGCPGQQPCDGLDACCKDHDACIDSNDNDLLNVECSQALLDCITRFRNSGEATFQGNKCSVSQVVDEIYGVIEAALVAGSIIHF
ncbi:phospholipase A2-alpha-like [Aristolochia californica]|uniref:phospholipase A2-alpha-like n=1 Tax=Aristolochia californica TaxID=171875 RepID=UPI0035D5D0EF